MISRVKTPLAPPRVPRRLLSRLITYVALSPLAAAVIIAQPPPGYYSGVDETKASTMRTTLHQAIDDHTRFPYTSGATDTWDILNLADEDPGDGGRIIDVYRNSSLDKMSGGVGPYNREHTWPNSYGFPDDNSSNYPFTDCHHLFLSDSSYNSSRSNKPYRDCDSGCNEKTTVFNDGRGGGAGVYPGNSNWTEGSFTQGTWQTWDGRKGDVARAILYMDIRYEGDTHGGTGADEPDLIATDNESLIDQSNTGDNEDVAYMGMLAEILQWHADDPVDYREVWRNEVVFSFQGNRNPFVDHPEWIDCLYGDTCGLDLVAPGPPLFANESDANGFVHLHWAAGSELDLAGYNVYRASSPGGPYSQLNVSPGALPRYTDLTVTNGTTYYYAVTALDDDGNESALSAELTAQPQANELAGFSGSTFD